MVFSRFSLLSRVVASREKLENNLPVTIRYYSVKLFSEYNEYELYFLKTLLIIPIVRFKDERNSRLSFLQFTS